jgi:ribosomal protein L32
MTPHPKRKHSQGRRDRRRAHDALVSDHRRDLLELR